MFEFDNIVEDCAILSINVTQSRSSNMYEMRKLLLNNWPSF